MRSILKTALAVLLVTALTTLPSCVNTSGQSSDNGAGKAPLTAAHASSLQTPPEAEVKPAPETAPPAAAPPAGLALPTPATATPPRPASPEEQTKAALEPKPVQAAALPQPKSEPAIPADKQAATKPAPNAAMPSSTTTVAAIEEPGTSKAAKKAEKPGAVQDTDAQKPGQDTSGSSAAKAPGKMVAVVGDSLAVGIGMTMSQHIQNYQGAGCFPLGKVSTGLISKRFFDWEKKLSELVAKEKLAAVVVMMGGNDANNPIAGKPAGTPEWDAAYREKAESFLRIAAQAGVKVLWVGLPAMRDPAYNKRVVAVNDAAKAACAKVGGCSYMEASAIFTDDSGKFVQAKSINGKKVPLRAKDGVHMTMNGYDLLCRQVLDKLTADGSLPAGK